MPRRRRRLLKSLSKSSSKSIFPRLKKRKSLLQLMGKGRKGWYEKDKVQERWE